MRSCADFHGRRRGPSLRIGGGAGTDTKAQDRMRMMLDVPSHQMS